MPASKPSPTFGTEWGWGAEEKSAQRLFDLYVDAGGNFIDTADLYTEGTSETWIGKFVAARGLRDRLMIATKFGYNAETSNPNAGGNHLKNLMRALDDAVRAGKIRHVGLSDTPAWFAGRAQTLAD